MTRIRKKFLKRNRIGLVFIILFIAYISLTLLKQEVKYRELREQEKQLMNDIRVLNSQIGDLAEEVDHTDSLDYIESLAREKLKMIKPDEIIYIIKSNNE